jgi:hypothetical protein
MHVISSCHSYSPEFVARVGVDRVAQLLLEIGLALVPGQLEQVHAGGCLGQRGPVLLSPLYADFRLKGDEPVDGRPRASSHEQQEL